MSPSPTSKGRRWRCVAVADGTCTANSTDETGHHVRCGYVDAAPVADPVPSPESREAEPAECPAIAWSPEENSNSDPSWACVLPLGHDGEHGDPFMPLAWPQGSTVAERRPPAPSPVDGPGPKRLNEDPTLPERLRWAQVNVPGLHWSVTALLSEAADEIDRLLAVQEASR